MTRVCLPKREDVEERLKSRSSLAGIGVRSNSR